jgi:hypothetical protein
MGTSRTAIACNRTEILARIGCVSARSHDLGSGPGARVGMAKLRRLLDKVVPQ